MSSEITPRTIITAPMLTREDVFDEVIYTLSVLHQASTAIDFPHTRGVLFALEAVKAMKEQEM